MDRKGPRATTDLLFDEPAPGARTAAGLLDIEEFAADFAELGITRVTSLEPVNLAEHYGTVAFSGGAAEST